MTNYKFCFLSVFFLLLLSSCDKIDQKTQYRAIIPIYEKMSSIRKLGISVVEPQTIDVFGKIYIYKDYLFINEPLKGIHVYDNANPANPKAVSFINILGNVDMAIKDGVLYADSYVDLLSFDLSNPENPKLVFRNEDVFKSLYRYNSENDSPTDIVSGYKDSIVSYEYKKTHNPMVQYDMDEANDGANSGQGGSMARFTLSKEHLYTVDNSNLNLFDVSMPQKPVFIKNITLGWGIEAIFPYKEKLFIGSNSGMYIYDISIADSPKELSKYDHLRACDPVVVNDDYAFVTLRTGAACAGTVNVLEVLDIKNPEKPNLIKSYQMQNPHGLALSGDVLYLCEGDYGFKSFNINNISLIHKNLLEHLSAVHSTDVIPGPKSLIIIGENGVCQYDYSDKAKLKQLSCIAKGQK